MSISLTRLLSAFYGMDPEYVVPLLEAIIDDFGLFKRIMIAWLNDEIDCNPIYYGPYDWGIDISRLIPIFNANIILTEAKPGEIELVDNSTIRAIFVQLPIINAIIPATMADDFTTDDPNIKYIIYRLGEMDITNEQLISSNFDWTQHYNLDAIIDDPDAIDFYNSSDRSNDWWATTDRFNKTEGNDRSWEGRAMPLIGYPENIQSYLQANYVGITVFSTNIDTDLVDLMTRFADL